MALAVRGAVAGVEASQWRDGKDEYDITVRLREEDRQSLRQLEAYTTMTRSSGNWEITMEKNPMPKPPSADAPSTGGGAAGAS